jgi:hypothetical protein
MKQKSIGIIMLIVGLGCGFYSLKLLYNFTTLPFRGTTAVGHIIGYKVSHNGARLVENSSSIKKPLSGRSPFFNFKAGNQTIKTYSHSPQLLSLLNYDIGDEVTVAYPSGSPQDAIIISWRELPGLLFLLAFGLLIVVVGKSYLFS